MEKIGQKPTDSTYEEYVWTYDYGPEEWEQETLETKLRCVARTADIDTYICQLLEDAADKISYYEETFGTDALGG